MYVSFLCRLSVHSALLNANNTFSIHLPAAVPALHTTTRIMQPVSCNATIVLACTDLHAKARLRSNTDLSVDTSFCPTNSSETADNRIRVDITIFATNDLRNIFLLGMSSWSILYVAGLQPLSKQRRGLNSIKWRWKLLFLVATKFRMAEVSFHRKTKVIKERYWRFVSVVSVYW